MTPLDRLCMVALGARAQSVEPLEQRIAKIMGRPEFLHARFGMEFRGGIHHQAADRRHGALAVAAGLPVSRAGVPHGRFWWRRAVPTSNQDHAYD
jgi:hypothetical protein